MAIDLSDVPETKPRAAEVPPQPQGAQTKAPSGGGTIDLSDVPERSQAQPQTKGEGLFTEAGRRVGEGLTKLGRAVSPRSDVQNLWGIPGSGRVGSAVAGAGDLLSAPFGPVGFLGSRGSAAVMSDQALDARIARAEKLKRERPDVAGVDPDVGDLQRLRQLRAMSEPERIRRDQERARGLAENTVGMLTGVAGAANPGWLLRAPANVAQTLRGVGGATRSSPLAPRPELADVLRQIESAVGHQTVRTGGHVIETLPARPRLGTDQVLNEAERILTGGARGNQRTLEAAQASQTGRTLDLGETGKRMAAQRGTYQPATIAAEQSVVREMEQELLAPPARTVSGEVGSPAAPDLRSAVGQTRGPLSAPREIFAPASVSKEAGETAAVIRSRLGEQARERAVTASLFKNVERVFDKIPVGQRLEFIQQMERGGAQRGPVLDGAAQGFRKALDDKFAEVTRLHPSAAEDYIEHYFPHLWENDQAATRIYAVKKGSVEGPKGFLKERTVPTIEVGLRAGLKLKDDNPARLVAQRLNDMDRYIAGQRVIEDLKSRGLAATFKAGEDIPTGWQRMPGSIPNASGLYTHPDAAMIMDRWLTPGLSGNKLFDTVRSVGNSMNQFQLGFSGFHLFFTSMDAMISRMALGFRELATPGMRVKGAKDVVLGLSPTTAWTNAVEGNKVLKAYLREPGYERFNNLADAVVKAGGRSTMDPFYRTGPLARGHFDQTWLGQFSSGIHRAAERVKASGSAIASGKVPTATSEAVRAVGEALNTASDFFSYPIMQKIVPTQKLGVFSKMAEFEIARLGPKASDLEVTQALQKAWDSVDNRMGQMVYDNLFWNKTLKDSLMLATRSVGWNAGTMREIGGGLGEYARVPVGKQKEFTHKMAYTAAFPIVAAVYGAITQYLLTGEGPREFKDYFAPRTGKVFPDGRPERVQLATYMRDVLAATKGLSPSPMAPIKVGENLYEMAKHKVHPLWQSMFEMLGNEDFYGAAIRDPQDPESKQLMDSLRFLAEQWTPLGARQIFSVGQGPVKPGFERSHTWLSPLGITPAPAAIERTAEQQAEVQAKIDRMKLSKKRKREARQ